jgi:branched-chain amino acid aminotransferase
MGMEVVERPVDRTELFLADEVFFTGTGVQVIAVTRIDHRAIGTGKMGQVVRQLRELYFNIVRGRVVRYRSHCIPVYRNEKEPKAAPAGRLTAPPRR